MLATDPQRLRDEGAKLFTQFLKPGDRLAIVEFSKGANSIRPLSDYSSDQSESVAADIAKVGTVGTYTDLYLGLQAAVAILRSSPREGAQPVIVLLSDGKMDPDPQGGTVGVRTDALLNDLLPDAKAQGFRIHTIAFSDQADKELLKQIAVASDGVNFFAPTAQEIHSSFAELFLAVKKPQVLPLTSKGFKIDAAIDEATFYINRSDMAGDIVLRSPSGALFSAKTKSDTVRWFAGQKFDVVTITQPEVGDWTIEGLPSGDSFATVLTNLKLVSEWPAAIYEGSPVLLQARLYESDKPIELPEMTGSIKYAVRITPTDRVSEPVVKEFLSDDGTHGDAIADDGIYTLSITLDQPGEYKLVLVAKAPTFERTQQIPFRVRERMVGLSLVEGGAEHATASHDDHSGGDSKHGAEPGHGNAPVAEAHADAEHGRFVITLSEEAERLKKMEVKLTAVDSDRKRYILSITPAHNAERSFEAGVNLLPHEGMYTLQATLTGEGRKKARITEVSQEVEYKKLPAEGEASVVAVVEQTEEKAPEKTTPTWLFVLILTVINGAVIAAAIVRLRKILTHSVYDLPEFPPPTAAIEAIAKLEQINARSDFPKSDPIFTKADQQFKVRGTGSVASSALATPAAAETEAATTTTEGESPSEEAQPDAAVAAEVPPASEPPVDESAVSEPAAVEAGPESTTEEPKSE